MRVGFLEEQAARRVVGRIEEYEAHAKDCGSVFRITKIAVELSNVQLQERIGFEEAAPISHAVEEATLTKRAANRIQQAFGWRDKEFRVRIPLVRGIAGPIDKEAALIS